MSTREQIENVFNTAAEKAGVPHRSSLVGTAEEAEAALLPTLEKLELEVRRAFDAAGLNFYAAWDILQAKHLISKGWNVTGDGQNTIISG